MIILTLTQIYTFLTNNIYKEGGVLVFMEDKSHPNQKLIEREFNQKMSDSPDDPYLDTFKTAYNSGNFDKALEILAQEGEGLVNRLNKKERKNMLKYCIYNYKLERKDGN